MSDHDLAVPLHDADLDELAVAGRTDEHDQSVVLRDVVERVSERVQQFVVIDPWRYADSRMVGTLSTSARALATRLLGKPRVPEV